MRCIVAYINIDKVLADSAAKGKLWWHGTSSWHMEKIKEQGLAGEVECKAWQCQRGIFFDRNASNSGEMWARNAVQAAAARITEDEISGEGYPGNKFTTRFIDDLQFIDSVKGWKNPDIVKNLKVPVEDLLPRKEYKRHIKVYSQNIKKLHQILLVIDEDKIPGNCFQKFNGHWHAGRQNFEFIRDENGDNRLTYPYGLDKVPDMTDEEREKAIRAIESELIVQDCEIPGNRFYACDVTETKIFGFVGETKENAITIALEG